MGRRELAGIWRRVAARLRRSDRQIAGLAAAHGHGGLSPKDAAGRAAQTLAALEGAMIVARSMGDLALFDRVADNLAAS